MVDKIFYSAHIKFKISSDFRGTIEIYNLYETNSLETYRQDKQE